MRHTLPLMLSLALATGCTTRAEPTRVISARATDWRAVVTNGDRERLREWRKSFTAALARARAAGQGDAIAREGVLLQPDLALPGPLPNGRYRCRVIKLGAKGAGHLDYVAYPAFACRVDARGPSQAFAKLGGSQRPAGTIFRHDALRQVFLGTMVLGDESSALRYGRDPERDLAAWVERVDANRWRMLIPDPRFESLTDVIELIPE